MMLAALLIMPAAFLYFAVKMGLTPLNAVVLALLSSTALSAGCWNLLRNPEADKQMIAAYKAEFVKQMDAVGEQLKAQHKDTPQNEEALETLKDNFTLIMEKSLMLVPSIVLFTWHLVSIGILYSLAAWLAPKFGRKLDPLPPFSEWRFDWNLVWLYIAGWAMSFLVGSHVSDRYAEMIEGIGANFLVISSILYFIAGFSILFYAFKKFEAGIFTRVGLSILSLIFSQILVWLGIIDIWADFRSWKTTKVSDDSDDNYLDF